MYKKAGPTDFYEQSIFLLDERSFGNSNPIARLSDPNGVTMILGTRYHDPMA
jgi:hypothetical protein